MIVLDVILGLAVLALLIYRQLAARPVNASALRLIAILVIIGLIQTYRVADYPGWEEIVLAGPGAVGLDLLIGEVDAVGRGLGPLVLAEFARTIAFTAPGTTAVVATVEEENRRSWRAFEKAGFRHVRDVEEDSLPNRLMRLDRPR